MRMHYQCLSAMMLVVLFEWYGWRIASAAESLPEIVQRHEQEILAIKEALKKLSSTSDAESLKGPATSYFFELDPIVSIDRSATKTNTRYKILGCAIVMKSFHGGAMNSDTARQVYKAESAGPLEVNFEAVADCRAEFSETTILSCRGGGVARPVVSHYYMIFDITSAGACTGRLAHVSRESSDKK